MVSSQSVFSSFSASGGSSPRARAFIRRRKPSPSRSTPQKARCRRSVPAPSTKRCSPAVVRLLPCNNSIISVWASVSVPVCSGVTTRASGLQCAPSSSSSTMGRTTPLPCSYSRGAEGAEFLTHCRRFSGRTSDAPARSSSVSTEKPAPNIRDASLPQG